jgi:NMD protein affecting ribosome stability and mRNA decay
MKPNIPQDMTCPQCGAHNQNCLEINGHNDAAPSEGDMMICAHCGSVCRLGKTRMRLATANEVFDAPVGVVLRVYKAHHSAKQLAEEIKVRQESAASGPVHSDTPVTDAGFGGRFQ